jgi:hypothetical protein
MGYSPQKLGGFTPQKNRKVIDLAAVLPLSAIQALSKERFAMVEIKGIEVLSRDLVLVY